MMTAAASVERPAAAMAALYVRMSSDEQVLSPELQERFLRAYAQAHGLQVARVYADLGKSGLVMARRAAMQRLLADVTGGRAGFSFLLVYDVSRWGRYQHPDEAGFYEFMCRQAGIQVRYCAEHFVNDGTPVAQLTKCIKRWMAAEYSRELSAKVFAGQCHLARLGYKQGGAATYGMRRTAYSADGEALGELLPGQCKPHATDRVRLTAGSADETAVVRRIFQLYSREGWSVAAIRRALNDEGVRCGSRAWSDYLVRSILNKPQYRGTQVFNRTSARLKTPRVDNPQETWICVPGVVAAAVTVQDAQQADQVRRMRHGDRESVLRALRDVYARRGPVTHSMLADVPGMPGRRRLVRMFGSLRQACALAQVACRSGRPAPVMGGVQAGLQAELCKQAQAYAVAAGATAAAIDGRGDCFRLNGAYTVRVMVALSRKRHRRRWRIAGHGDPPADFVIAGLLDADNTAIECYALIAVADEVRPVIVIGDNRRAGAMPALHTDLGALFGHVTPAQS